jgi:hypothetical protein
MLIRLTYREEFISNIIIFSFGQRKVFVVYLKDSNNIGPLDPTYLPKCPDVCIRTFGRHLLSEAHCTC